MTDERVDVNIDPVTINLIFLAIEILVIYVRVNETSVAIMKV